MALLVRSYDGRTHFLHAEEAGVRTVGALRQWASDQAGLPCPSLVRLKCGSRDLACDAMELDVDMSVHALLRLPGGKGGFGAMLRTAGTKGVKTTNFDACRDLNGRRLRYVNQEAKLREWEAQAEERKRKKQAEKDAARSCKPSANIARFDDDEYDEMLQTTRDSVAEAVAAAVVAASSSAVESTDGAGCSSSGSKRAAEAPSAAPSKFAKMWADPLAGLEGSSSEEEEAKEEAPKAARKGKDKANAAPA
eukprot:CAMPEP_0119058816 /NCGR_PEP_ID=MMETSP1178-20130426/3086_1 /TAXON_ID=33656 /ORGANISM="unid sp, Strain CCMP2000" /LENGTH=249 /DNA_ID=CAMNT_0007039803 /DNA_START=29 /DNA_END=778 /DNA_ORIENTATION=+